ncbi:MAG: Gldg family protein [Acidobacteriota bacterium]
MNKRMLKSSLVLTLVLAALNLVAFNILIAGFSWMRADLTEEGIYSITPATRRLLSSLDDNLTITGYFSRRTHPKLAPLVPAIQDLLEEYRALSRDRVHIEIVDPGEDEVAEQEANDRFGVESTPFRLASKYESGIVNAYFAVVVRYGDQYVRYGFQDLIQVDPLPDGDIDVHLRNLEYDLTRAIKKVVYGFHSTADLFDQIEGPVKFTAVMTPDVLPDILSKVPDAVRKAAQELGEKSGGRFVYEEIDPTSSEQAQADVMARFGAQPMSLGLFSDQQFYLNGYLQVGDRIEQLMLAAEGVTAAAVREAVDSSLRREAPGFLKTVGVVAPGPSIPPEVMQQLQMQGQMPQQPPPEYQQIKQVLGQDYTVQDVNLSSPVPSDVDVLLVLKPKDFGDEQVYNLDQYMMRGGRVILCSGAYEANFTRDLSVTPVHSGLEDWLAFNGVTVQKSLVLDDRNQPLPIPQARQTVLGTIRTWVMKPYPYLVEVRDEGLLSREMTARLEAVGIYWGSPISVDPEKAGDLDVTEILRSSPASWTSDDLSSVRYTDYTVPAEGTQPQLLAVALSGKFKSFFADKQPPTSGSDSASSEGGAEKSGPTQVPLKESTDTRLVVIGDTAFISDFVARALGRQHGGFFTENLAFVQNLIDWTNLDSDMLSIRARGGGARRLARTERGTEMAVEGANYIIPILVLLGLGTYRAWRRRNTEPLIAVAPVQVRTRRASQEG